MLQNLCIIKHSVKKMCVGVEVWLHEVWNLGTIWRSNTECGMDSFVVQHYTVFISVLKPTMWNTVLYGGMTACRPHSTTWHYSTTLHFTLDMMHCALPGCRSHFTFATTGSIHFSPLTAHISTKVQEHNLTWQLTSNSTQTILGDVRQHSMWFQSATSGVHSTLAQYIAFIVT